MLAFTSRKRKQSVTLIEVLIAFTLILFCLVPLIQPHVGILKEQHKFMSKVKLDHAVNLYTSHIIEKLHKNEIPWHMIEEGKVMPVESEVLQRLSPDQVLPFRGVYRFDVVKSKPKNAEPGTPKAYLLKLNMLFLPGKADHSITEYTDKKNPYQYDVDLFVKRF